MRFLKGTLENNGPKTGPPESTKWVDTFHFSSKINGFRGFSRFSNSGYRVAISSQRSGGGVLNSHRASNYKPRVPDHLDLVVEWGVSQLLSGV